MAAVYAQSTIIRVPMGMMPEMRRLIEQDYLPKVQMRPGFVAAYLLEQEDDEDYAELITMWASQAAAEDFAQTSSLEASPRMLVALLPGTRVQRQGYRVRVRTEEPKYARTR